MCCRNACTIRRCGCLTRGRSPSTTKGTSRALWVDLKALQALGNPKTLQDQAAWSRGLAPLGIGPDMDVYVYDADRQHMSGRIWWLLASAGVGKAGLVDGGFPLWSKQGRPVVTEVPKVEPREFVVRFHPQWVATRADVRKATRRGDEQIVDARTAAEYRGEVKPQDGSRAGHIPTAISFDAYDLVDADGRLLSPSTSANGCSRPASPWRSR